MAGHSHYRRFNVYDGRTAAIESGNYFNTVGWLSYTLPPAGSKTPLRYQWRMIDANKATLTSAAGIAAAGGSESLLTERGASLREDLMAVRMQMGLDGVLGCNPSAVVMSPSGSLDMADESSVWGFVMRSVVPAVLFDPPNNPRMWEGARHHA